MEPKPQKQLNPTNEDMRLVLVDKLDTRSDLNKQGPKLDREFKLILVRNNEKQVVQISNHLRASNSKVTRARVILKAIEEVTLEYILRFEFFTSNNQAEYEALIVGLNMAREIGATKIKVRLDS
ncbi:hypothetical protein L6164_008495 [Bauhinia variegata]|uniref:Uncharacterized protein n=1 Tax=Bauhinia variegata TaxID=167791 RepID=A0ACB9PGY4_BAUVA|nr:hypothetical protein L6164_008495 [Bauhinia variegata]